MNCKTATLKYYSQLLAIGWLSGFKERQTYTPESRFEILSLKLTEHLKMDGWKMIMIFLLGFLFSGSMLVFLGGVVTLFFCLDISMGPQQWLHLDILGM